MVSINTALQVDLTGKFVQNLLAQCNIVAQEVKGYRHRCIHSKNGRSIIALYSTVKDDTISTIQPYLTPGAAVTLHRNDVDYIITEYGIADERWDSKRTS